MKSTDELFDEIVSRNLETPDVRDDMTAADVPGWDSMNYLRCIAELEEAFSMSFAMDEVVDAKTIGEVRAIVHARGS